MEITNATTDTLQNIELLLRLGSWESAERECWKLLQLSPRIAAGWVALGLVGLASQRVEQAGWKVTSTKSTASLGAAAKRRPPC